MSATDAAIPPQESRLTVLAPAKVNLYLEMTGIRADGYHLIDSLIAFAEFGDRITLERSETASLFLSGPFVAGLSANEDNLAMRALRLMERLAGRALPVTIRVEKNLPSGAGLGGGSADAAAVLRGLRHMFRLTVDMDVLAREALALGADLPVCLSGTPSQVTGIGEAIRPFDGMPDLPVVLAHPGVSLSTPAVFKLFDEMDAAETGRALSAAGEVGFIGELQCRRNDLEAAAISLAPVVGEVLSSLSAAQGCRLARMSGSGSACFGVFSSDEEAVAAASLIEEQHPSWWLRSTRLTGSRGA